MRTRNFQQSRAPGFSLIEIMVAVTLLSLIIIGLLAVFNHTQRALRAANNQTDVLEGARATVNLIARDLTSVAASQDPNGVNLFASNTFMMTLQRPGGGEQTNVLSDLFLLSRDNDVWRGIGYFLDVRNAGVGTLYRFDLEGYGIQSITNGWFDRFERPALVGDTNVHRVADGIVHFQAHAYDERGRVMTSWPQARIWPPTNVDAGVLIDLTNNNNIAIGPGGFFFRKEFLPAYVELELGFLEPVTTRQFHAIETGDPLAAKTFLEGQIGKMHLFRERIPIRNHVQPPAFD